MIPRPKPYERSARSPVPPAATTYNFSGSSSRKSRPTPVFRQVRDTMIAGCDGLGPSPTVRDHAPDTPMWVPRRARTGTRAVLPVGVALFAADCGVPAADTARTRHTRPPRAAEPGRTTLSRSGTPVRSRQFPVLLRRPTRTQGRLRAAEEAEAARKPKRRTHTISPHAPHDQPATRPARHTRSARHTPRTTRTISPPHAPHDQPTRHARSARHPPCTISPPTRTISHSNRHL